MSGELLTRDEAQDLADAPDLGGRNPVAFVPIPATIIVKDWGILDCGGDNSWGYTPYGIFASGTKRGHEYPDTDAPAEHDVLFPYNSIVAVEFDYPTFFKSQGLGPDGEPLESPIQPAEGKGGGANLELSVPNQDENDGDEDSGD
jgi:hypothetical protein